MFATGHGELRQRSTWYLGQQRPAPEVKLKGNFFYHTLMDKEGNPNQKVGYKQCVLKKTEPWCSTEHSKQECIKSGKPPLIMSIEVDQ